MNIFLADKIIDNLRNSEFIKAFDQPVTHSVEDLTSKSIVVLPGILIVSYYSEVSVPDLNIFLSDKSL